MYDRILAAVDGSENANRAAARAGRLAAATGGELILVTVEPRTGVPEQLRAYARAEHLDQGPTRLWEEIAREILRQAREQAHAGSGLDAARITEDTLLGDPADAIADAARDRRVDVVVVGSRGHGRVAGLLIGSVSQKLAATVEADVLVVR